MREDIPALFGEAYNHGNWIDDTHFHWQSQNATDPTSKRGDEIIRHAALGIVFGLTA